MEKTMSSPLPGRCSPAGIILLETLRQPTINMPPSPPASKYVIVCIIRGSAWIGVDVCVLTTAVFVSWSGCPFRHLRRSTLCKTTYLPLV